MIPINILDYSPIDEGATSREALLQTTELAKHAEALGYKRFWVSEHHNVSSVAGSTPEMLMMHLATSTSSIRIGSGGVMLPHYSSYKVAENFRMLEALHPNRIDLGIGRSPSFRMVNRALNEGKEKRVDYEQQIKDIMKYFTDNVSYEHRFQDLRATPIIPTKPEVWLLGSSKGSAKLAARNGTAYAYAHFAKPTKEGIDTVKHYQSQFQASPINHKPITNIAVFAVVGETNEEAEEIAKALDLWLLSVESNQLTPYYPSIETAINRGFSSIELEKVLRNRKRMVVGNPQTVKAQIENIVERYHTDEVTIIPNVYGTKNRMKGIERLANAFSLF
ncbi:LLM class flavin-dependent oxidoreductase [Oceanobacillus halotolerans]|uniref:LLM class flavin-dependent oxidoreductase n=1 Tax=Oceanobacillus halotolerans TaxID=2663380 RepID=UPI0013DCC42C|nr:LLM class flavin-dependent oxidoreductase [Oceanobacillus halotolerans]